MRTIVCVYPLLIVVHLTGGQSVGGGSDRRLINRRPVAAGGASAACGEEYDTYSGSDSRSLLAVLGGATVGGVLGGAVGYHIGMKHGKPVLVNNIYNQLPSPCYSIPVHVTAGSGSGGGGIIGGLLSHHPILSNILQGGILSGIGNGGGYGQGFQTNRNIRQFHRQVVRPLTRIFKK